MIRFLPVTVRGGIGKSQIRWCFDTKISPQTHFVSLLTKATTPIERAPLVLDFANRLKSETINISESKEVFRYYKSNNSPMEPELFIALLSHYHQLKNITLFENLWCWRMNQEGAQNIEKEELTLAIDGLYQYLLNHLSME
jgi:hypothetical protein